MHWHQSHPLVATWILPCSPLLAHHGSKLLAFLPCLGVIIKEGVSRYRAGEFLIRSSVLLWTEAFWPWSTVFWMGPSTHSLLSQDLSISDFSSCLVLMGSESLSFCPAPCRLLAPQTWFHPSQAIGYSPTTYAFSLLIHIPQ